MPFPAADIKALLAVHVRKQVEKTGRINCVAIDVPALARKAGPSECIPFPISSGLPVVHDSFSPGETPGADGCQDINNSGYRLLPMPCRCSSKNAFPGCVRVKRKLNGLLSGRMSIGIAEVASSVVFPCHTASSR